MVAAALGERVKTTECCFYEAKSTKQGVEGAVILRHETTMRLDRYENPGPNAYRFSGIRRLRGYSHKNALQPTAHRIFSAR